MDTCRLILVRVDQDGRELSRRETRLPCVESQHEEHILCLKTMQMYRDLMGPR